MSRYRPDPRTAKNLNELAEYVDRQLWRISTAIEQQFDNEPVWEDLRFPASGLALGPSSPGFSAFNGNIATTLFDGVSTAEYVHFGMQMPHGSVEGQVVSPHIHWTTMDATSNAAMVWTLEYTWANVNGTFPSSTTITATGSCSATGVHHITALPDITLSSGTISLMLLGRLGRDPTVSGDTFAHDVAMLEFDFHVQMDGGGSVKEYVKL